MGQRIWHKICPSRHQPTSIGLAAPGSCRSARCSESWDVLNRNAAQNVLFQICEEEQAHRRCLSACQRSERSHRAIKKKLTLTETRCKRKACTLQINIKPHQAAERCSNAYPVPGASSYHIEAPESITSLTKTSLAYLPHWTRWERSTTTRVVGWIVLRRHVHKVQR